MHRLSLSILPDRLAICRLPPESAIPAPPAGGGLWSVTRTADELSIVLPEAARLPDWQAETGWRAFRVDGTLDFGLTGIMASLTTPLAGAGVSLFTLSTWDTDYILVREKNLVKATAALTEAGYTVRRGDTMTSFKDHFSGHAASYAAHRPGYPPRLFEILAALPQDRYLAWDSGTGNGQAAVALADHFERVLATDPSAEQLAHALPHPRVEYSVGRAEDSGIFGGCADLVTAAQAFHWYDFDRFFDEVRRVLVPGGVVAVWTYNLARVDPEVDGWIDRLAKQIVGPWWPPERRWVDEEYRTIPFPFDEIEIAPLSYEVDWDLDRLTRYIRTWSSFQRCQKETGRDPLDEIREGLTAAWGDPSGVRTVTWPIFIRAGRVTP